MASVLLSPLWIAHIIPPSVCFVACHLQKKKNSGEEYVVDARIGKNCRKTNLKVTNLPMIHNFYPVIASFYFKIREGTIFCRGQSSAICIIYTDNNMWGLKRTFIYVISFINSYCYKYYLISIILHSLYISRSVF